MKNFNHKIQQFVVAIGILGSGIGSGINTPVQALSFNFSADPQTDARAIAGFQQAGALWSSALTDNVTVNLTIGFTDLSKSDPGTIGLTSSNQVTVPNYNSIYQALKTDRTSTDDNAAVASLPNTATISRLINYTSDNGGSATPYLNADSAVTLTTANAKALGFGDASLMLAPGQVDGSITFASNYNWDFSHSSQMAANSYDFVGVAAHEIGHALGFISGVDNLYSNRGTQSADKLSVTPLDLFRYSEQSKAQKAIDATLGSPDKYFSLDGGVTKIASFETGLNYEASHWLNGQNKADILNPTIINGQLQTISANDLRAMDAIGWNLATVNNSLTTAPNQLTNAVSYNGSSASDIATSVPEPASYLGTLMFTLFGVGFIIKFRQNSVTSIGRSTVDAEV